MQLAAACAARCRCGLIVRRHLVQRPLCSAVDRDTDFIDAEVITADDFGAGRNNIFAENIQGTVPLRHDTRNSEQYWRALNVDNQPSRRNEAVAVKKKRLEWAARKRGWAECGHFLNAFVDSDHWRELEDAESLEHLERLLICDDMFLMKLVGCTRPVPAELQSRVLVTMQTFASETVKTSI